MDILACLRVRAECAVAVLACLLGRWMVGWQVQICGQGREGRKMDEGEGKGETLKGDDGKGR